ncbi:MAG TPA: helix-turn-helix transcriptional regulator [Candidatus Hydrogenedentes bacterium]|nr:helix-turn-helix transcriptional regulator [Candidatus Hydrogenedentota bacterium]
MTSSNVPGEEASVRALDADDEIRNRDGYEAETREVFLKRLGQRLRELRKRKGLRQEDFDDDTALSITVRGLQGIEYGEKNPKIYTLYKMSQKLGLNLSEVLDLDG